MVTFVAILGLLILAALFVGIVWGCVVYFRSGANKVRQLNKTYERALTRIAAGAADPQNEASIALYEKELEA